MTPLRWVEVSKGALIHNTRVVRRLVGPARRFWAVVKADGYGHGAVTVARAALAGGADGLAVTYVEEAVALRRAGLTAPVLVTGPADPAQAGLVVRLKLAVMVDNRDLVAALSRAAGPTPVPVHVEVDLGLARWGVPLNELARWAGLVQRSAGLSLAGVFAHAGYVPGKNDAESFARLRVFRRRVDVLMPGVCVHAANSALLLNCPDVAWDAVRVGNLLYGINPTARPLDLKSPWRPLSTILRVRRVRRGERLGYGGTFRAGRPMTVATVPVGYAHGLTLEPAAVLAGRAEGFGYYGVVRGVRCPLVGKPGMSHTLVDVSGVPHPRVGEPIQLPLRRTASQGWLKRVIR